MFSGSSGSTTHLIRRRLSSIICAVCADQIWDEIWRRTSGITWSTAVNPLSRAPGFSTCSFHKRVLDSLVDNHPVDCYNTVAIGSSPHGGHRIAGREGAKMALAEAANGACMRRPSKPVRDSENVQPTENGARERFGALATIAAYNASRQFDQASAPGWRPADRMSVRGRTPCDAGMLLV